MNPSTRQPLSLGHNLVNALHSMVEGVDGKLLKLTSCACLMVVRICGTTPQSPVAEKWTHEMTRRIPAVQQAEPSPRGDAIICEVAEVIASPSLDAPWTKSLYLVTKDAKKLIGQGVKAAWSPDGSRVAYLAYEGGRRDGKRQLKVYDLNRDVTVSLLDEAKDLREFKWSPTGLELALGFELPGKREGDPDAAIFLLQAEVGAKPRRITPEGMKVLYDQGIDWAPDGKSITFIQGLPAPGVVEFNDFYHAKLATIRVADGLLRTYGEEMFWDYPRWSRDGKWIAAVGLEGVNTRLRLVNVTTGAFTILPQTTDSLARIVGWDASNRLIAFESAGTRSSVIAWKEGQDAFVRLDDDRMTIDINYGFRPSLDPSGRILGYVAETWDQPAEPYSVLMGKAWQPQAYKPIVEAPRLSCGRTDVIRWQSFDGLWIEGLLTYPIGWQKGTTVPLLVEAHGGPMDRFQNSYLGDGDVVVYASEGFAVLRVNVRGSTGYGRAFREGNNRSFHNDVEDLISGAKHLVTEGIADPKRLGVMGWSYGGYLTARAMTHPSHLFRAAMVGAGISDVKGNLDGALAENTFANLGGKPWEVPAAYQAVSPIYHLGNAAKVAVLIQHGTEDRNIPFSQGRELFWGLQFLGADVEFVPYKGMGHWATTVTQSIAIEQKTIGWMKAKLK